MTNTDIDQEGVKLCEQSSFCLFRAARPSHDAWRQCVWDTVYLHVACRMALFRIFACRNRLCPILNFNPMEINDEILETISRERCARARDILRRSGIVEAWREAGAQVEIVGSLRMGLMMKHRDIDLHIYSAPLTLDRSFAAMSRIAACPDIGRIEGRNLMSTEERCVEWHAEWAEPDDGTWMIDMIYIERGSRYDGYFERMADGVRRAADDEMRRAILRLKWLTPDDVHIMGVEYYRAVIEGGVRSYGEFERWRAEHPAEGVVEWIP